MAISGLILFGFFFIYPMHKLIDMYHEHLRLEGEARVLAIEVDFLTEEADSLADEIKRLEILVNEVSHIAELTQQQVSTLAEKSKELAEKSDRLQDKRKSISIRKEEIKTKSNLQDKTMKAVKVIFWLSLVGIAVGLSCSLVGGRLWYKKIQIHHDTLTKSQAESEIT